jgi:hypothetical protein
MDVLLRSGRSVGCRRGFCRSTYSFDRLFRTTDVAAMVASLIECPVATAM